ncbi:flagellar basal-body MS-ring/collar protein FliF [Rhodanobacter sp. DHB23]|uniref:flagellar basal-body MS-ring/collar protein FliF n=1 Tax=Rhodanobacter sp. DHB23 TaxID=2775923 RepID=UPI001780AC47|nr:flagellar basal-body MS-ring/collar protein FliF [Rhodanobacter sp. DHB23]MBD8871253.1 flagellar M-ring protein FliF [Rhodanobacter sp. DHB23]
MADNAIATTDSNSSGVRLDSLKQITRNPAARQLVLLVAVAAAVALGVAVVLWSRGPNYGLLYAGLDQKDAAAITQELQAANVAYKVSDDGSSIMAPASDLGAMRLRLAAKGLPQGSAAINAQANNDSPFGMSDLAERTHYQQMLENDLGSTIASLQSVRAARVHLALPKPSPFIRDNHEASASVLLTLYQGRSLDPGQVAAIVHLVASSVPGLDPGQVSVVDQQGQLLTSNSVDAAGAAGDSRLRLATRIENTYAQRIEELLTPLVGPGRVHAQVNADLDFSQSEKATETYNPDNPALRSEQVSSEQHTGGDASNGIPGALSNQPPATVAQPTAARPNAGTAATPGSATASASRDSSSSSSATRNFELDRTISHVSDPAGRLARLTVAVVVDNKVLGGGAPAANGAKAAPKSVPFTPQELQHLTDLVKNSVGFDATRGDTVSVVNQAFHDIATPDNGPSIPFWDRPGMLDLIKQGVGVLIALLVAFGLLRPLLKGLLRGTPARVEAAALPRPMPTVSVRVGDDGQAAGPGQQQQPAHARLDVTPTQAYEQRVGHARRMVGENSKQVAQVVRNWVNEDGN